jgi:hypothetical protein
MKQHPIDLLPETIYARSQAGLRMGRVVSALGLAAAALVVTATHSRVAVRAEQERLAQVSERANVAFAIDARAAELRRELAHVRKFTDLYDKIAHPVNISAIIATVINHLPASITLDQLDVNTSTRQARAPGAPRSKGPESAGKNIAAGGAAGAPRQLVGELSGFAASDQQIAELVRSLETMALFTDVSLDYSRTRVVRDVSAREFRLSFRVDLDAQYVVEREASGHQRIEASRHQLQQAPSMPGSLDASMPFSERTAHVNE